MNDPALQPLPVRLAAPDAEVAAYPLMRVIANLVSNAIKYTREGRILIGLRRHLNALSGGALTPFWTHNPAVLGFQRGQGTGAVLVLANFSEQVQVVKASVLTALPDHAVDLVSGGGVDLRGDLSLHPYQQCWLLPA